MSRPDNPDIKIAGRQVDAARDLVATCILSPAIDAGADAEPETVAEARAAARVLTRLGWPGPPVADIVLNEGEAALIRRAAIAGLGAAADEVQEAALAATHDGADLDVHAALEEMERARRVLDGVGWTAAGGGALPGRGTLGREIEERFAALVHALPALIVVTDADGRLELCSDAVLHGTGLSADELRRGGWRRLVDRRDLTALAGAFRAARDEQRMLQAEFRVRRADGERRRMRVTATPRIERDGSLSGYVGIAEDVTDLRAARDARAAGARESAMTFTRSAALWMVDTDGRCTYMNRGWYDLFGFDPRDESPDFMGRLHPDDRAAAVAFNTEALRSRVRSEFECRYDRDGTGEYSWMRVVAEPREEDGRFAGLVGTCTDITRRHRAEEGAAAILRIAEAAALGATAPEIYHRSATEARDLLDLDLALVVRFDGEDGVVVGTSGDAAIVGSRLPPVSGGVLAEVRETGRTCRLGDMRGLPAVPSPVSGVVGMTTYAIAAPLAPRGGPPWGALVGTTASGPQGIEVAEAKLGRVAVLLAATLVLCDVPARVPGDMGGLTA